VEISRLATSYPGRFEHGPDEKLGLLGLLVGFMMSLI